MLVFPHPLYSGDRVPVLICGSETFSWLLQFQCGLGHVPVEKNVALTNHCDVCFSKQESEEREEIRYSQTENAFSNYKWPILFPCGQKAKCNILHTKTT